MLDEMREYRLVASVRRNPRNEVTQVLAERAAVEVCFAVTERWLQSACHWGLTFSNVKKTRRLKPALRQEAERVRNIDAVYASSPCDTHPRFS